MPEPKQGPAPAAPAADPLSATLAEMRAAGNSAGDMTLVPTERLTQWADRIKAATERAEDDDERGIITIHDPCDAESLAKYLELVIQVAEVKYPVDSGWSKPIVETRRDGWYVYVYIQRREIKEAADA